MSSDLFVSYPLPVRGELMIGRSATADIKIRDPLASRKHALLHMGETLTVEDLKSANGTRVKDKLLPPEKRVAIGSGEVIFIGSTCLVVQPSPTPTLPRRLWSHTYFEDRVRRECNQASRSGSSFGIGRIWIERGAPWERVIPVLLQELNFHLLAAYGPNEYEVLLRNVDAGDAEKLLHGTVARLIHAGHHARSGLAWFPYHGRTHEALIAHARPLVKTKPSCETLSPLVTPLEPRMQRIYDIAKRAAAGSINVLVLGETGVGKEVLAQAIHDQSPRAEKRILCLNCAGFTEALLESELFGYEKGAFTGATQGKLGLLETAQGGTIFLDEVGELPPVVQAKLLRVIERREVMRLGALRARPIDVRFIAATNRDLESDVMSGRFRRDLFYRLNGISLTVPPLRERVSEIGPLALKFLSEACRDYGREPSLRISRSAEEVLERYGWPGNIRELRNVMERAVVLCTGLEIGPEHLPADKMPPSWAGARVVLPISLGTPELCSSAGAETRAAPANDLGMRQRIIDALATCAGNQSRAARLLGISRRTLVDRLKVYDIPRPRKTS